MKTQLPSGKKCVENHLRLAREAAGLTQEQAAELLQCEPRSLRRYETGERLPRADIIQRMMWAYDCEFATLFPDDIPCYEFDQ